MELGHALLVLRGMQQSEKPIFCFSAVIERAGHFTPLEEPQAVAGALCGWLQAPI